MPVDKIGAQLPKLPNWHIFLNTILLSHCIKGKDNKFYLF